MHTFDVISLIIALIFIIIGIKRGFIIEIFRLIAMIGGFIIAFLYYKDLLSYLPLKTVPLPIQGGISFVVLYIVTALSILGIGWTLKKVIHFSLLGWADRLLGACVGMCKTALLIWVACMSISSFSSDHIRRDFDKSFTYRLYKWLPSALELDGITKIRDTFRKINKKTLKISEIQKNSK